MNKTDLLNQMMADLYYLKMESTILIGAVVLLIVGLIYPSERVIKIVYASVLCAGICFGLAPSTNGPMLSSSLFLTSTASSFSMLILMAGGLLLVFPRDRRHATEFYFLCLSLIGGSLFLMVANSFLVVYVSIELVSFASYILTNFSFNKGSHEAGIKYLLFGAVSSAIMLFGLVLLYGTTGTFYLSKLEASMFIEPSPSLGLLLMVFGLFFKASIFPFHLWVPATYQTAPVDAVALISIVPKLSSIVVIQRVLLSLAFHHWIVPLCLVLGILTLLSGILGALRQQHVRRMISLGAIAHSGFLLPFACMPPEESIFPFWWYSSVYVLMNIFVFYLISIYEGHKIQKLTDYRSLGSRMPLVGVAFSIVLISLIGLPPTAGFTAKFFLFTSLWKMYLVHEQTIYLTYLIIATLVTVVSLFFYFKIPYQMYLVPSIKRQPMDVAYSSKIIVLLFSILLLMLFFIPQTLTILQQLLNNIIYE